MLALYDFQHRRSFNVNIFIYDPQLFSFLAPKWILDNDESAFSHDYEESADHIRLLVENSGIRVDFILSPLLFPQLLRKNELLPLDFPFCVESVEEIIAKKFKFRRKKNLARDIFDMALAIEKHPSLLEFLYEQHVLSIEGLVEWDTALHELDTEQFRVELNMVSPSPDKMHIAKDAPNISIEAIHALRRSILHTG